MTTDRPGPPFGLVLKLRRARKHLRQLRRSIERYVAANKGQLTREVNTEGTHYLYRMIFADAPQNVQILADEAVHHMRSILDHLMTSIIENSGKPTPYDVQFPTLLIEPKTPRAIADFERMIGSIQGPARDFIIDLQPYQRGDAAKTHPLWILSRLDNRFKHTSLHLFVFRIGAPDLPGVIRHGLGQTQQEGAIFAEVPVTLNVEEDFEPHVTSEIAFGLQETGIDTVYMVTLDEIHDFIRDEVLHKAVPDFRLPPRLIPKP